MVRCHACALAGSTSTDLLRGGKSSNTWRYLDYFAASPQVSDLQRRRYAENARPLAASTRGQEGTIEGYLRAARTRELSASPIQPHHLRLVLMMIMTLFPFALAENEDLLEFVRGIGVPYDLPALSTVRDVLLNIFILLTRLVRTEVR